MSKLEFLSRPLVKFDPSNKEHRRYYAEFLEYRGWGRCPVRFICPDDAGMDMTVMIKNQLVSFYIDREFGGSGLAEARAAALKEEADELYRTAAAKRKEAEALHRPRRNLG